MRTLVPNSGCNFTQPQNQIGDVCPKGQTCRWSLLVSAGRAEQHLWQQAMASRAWSGSVRNSVYGGSLLGLQSLDRLASSTCMRARADVSRVRQQH